MINKMSYYSSLSQTDMSNFATRGTGRGKPQTQDHVINVQPQMPATFAVPVVQQQTGDFRPDYAMPPHAQNFAYRTQGYDHQHQQQYYQPQQQQYYQRPDYQYQQYNMYQQAPYMDQMQYQQQQQQQQPAQASAQPHPPPPQQKRKKAILNIVDPNTLEPVVIASTQEETPAAETSTPATATTAAVTVAPAPEVTQPSVERKNQAKTDLMEQIKKELSSSQPNTESNAHAAPSAPVNVEPKAVESAAPVPAPVVVEAAPPVEQTPVVQEVAKSAVVKADSKDEAEPDDKFEEAPAAREAVSSQSEDTPPEVEKTPEELAREEAEREEAEKERKRVREIELDTKLAGLLDDLNEVNVSAGVFGRSFMATLREIEREFKRTPCPLSPAELNDFGLDINTMSKSEKKTNFTPAWMTKNKTAYRGRTTTDGTGRGGSRQDRGMTNKRPPPVRQSIERVQRITLPTSKDAWKPERQRTGAFESTPEEDSVKVVCKQVRALMNKITPTSKEALTKEFISYNVSSDDQQLAQVVSIIFDKAVEEPKFCSLYAEVCKNLVDHELKVHKGQSKSAFRNAILTRAQATFADKTYEVTEEQQRALETETDEQKKLTLQLAVLEARTKFRRRKFGNMTFIGHLYRNQLLSTKIIHVCIFELLKTIVPPENSTLKEEDVDEESVHCALQLIETLGAIIDKSRENGTALLNQWFEKLESAKPFCTNKIRFMIMNVAELRENKWIPRKSVESGPKKLEEIHKDIRQEQLENEKARDQYENKRQGGGIRSNSNSLRGKGIPSRNSIERKQPDQKRAAAANSSKHTSSNNLPPRNMALSQLDTISRSKKDWSSGSAGGGTSEASQQSQSDNNRKNSVDQRKKSTTIERQAAISAAKNIAGSAAAQISERRSTSQNSIAELEDVELTEEQQAAREVIMQSIKMDLEEVEAGDSTPKDAVDGLLERVGNEKYAKPTLANVYEMVIRAVSEKVLNDKLRITLARILRLSITDKERKQAFINGVEKFCKYAVDVEAWIDLPKLWSVTGEVLMNMSHVPHDVITSEQEQELKIEQVSFADLAPVFMAAHTPEGSKKFELFVEYLKRWTEVELEESKASVAEGVSWEYQELQCREEMEKMGLVDELEKCTTKANISLKKALKM